MFNFVFVFVVVLLSPSKSIHRLIYYSSSSPPPPVLLCTSRWAWRNGYPLIKLGVQASADPVELSPAAAAASGGLIASFFGGSIAVAPAAADRSAGSARLSGRRTEHMTKQISLDARPVRLSAAKISANHVSSVRAPRPVWSAAGDQITPESEVGGRRSQVGGRRSQLRC